MSDEKTKNLEVEEDCPAELINLFDASSSAWRKAVIKQFIELHGWRVLMTHKLGRLERYEKIIITLLIITVGAAFTEVIPSLIEALVGIV